MSKHGLLSNPFNLQDSKSISEDESHELLKDIQYAFDLFDREKKGSVTVRDVKAALRAFGIEAKKADVEQVLEQHMDYHPGSNINWKIFEKILRAKLKARTPNEELKQTFEVFDIEGKGKIDFSTLKRVVRHLNMQINDQELKEMITEFDLDGDGAINQEEFMSLMCPSET